MRDFGLSDADRFPLLDAAGRAMLDRLRQDPHAPRYNWQTGERLTTDGLADVDGFATLAANEPPTWRVGEEPPWVEPFRSDCRGRVPFYRDRDPLAVTTRDDLRRRPWDFVPDGKSLDDLIVYTTSGTTGSRLTLPATPQLPARYLPLFRLALAQVGVSLDGGAGRVGVVHLCHQRETVVLCGVSHVLGGAGFVKVNLHDAGWRNPAADRDPFLRSLDSELVTGDPATLLRLAAMTGRPLRPKAVLSAGATLLPEARRRITADLECPVIDMFSTNETGPIGFDRDGNGFRILQPRLFVEVLDDDDRPVPPGVVGRLAFTGGLNTHLPLIRYLTGDEASLVDGADGPRLTRLHGRPSVRFFAADGIWFSSVDLLTSLSDLPLLRLEVRQQADGVPHVLWDGDECELAVRLAGFFGRPPVLTRVAGGGDPTPKFHREEPAAG